MGLTRRRALFAALVVACVACRIAAAEGKPVPPPAAAPNFELPESELFASDFDPVVDRVTWEHPQIFGLALSAPRRVDTSAREMLPVALLEGTDGLRDWDTHRARNTVLVGIDLTDGTVRAANARPIKGKRYDPSQLPRSRVGEPLPSAKDTRSMNLERVDARDLLVLPWLSGRHAFAVLQQDWRTTLETVELTGGAAETPNELSLSVEQLRELAARRESPALPSFAKRSDSPPTPADGLALNVVATQDGVTAAGSFRLKLPGHARLPKDLADWLQAKAGKTPVPQALLRVTLLVLVRDDPTPPRLDLLVPVYAPQDGVGEGHFALDLRGAREDGIPTGDHNVWAVAGDQLYGPFALSLK